MPHPLSIKVRSARPDDLDWISDHYRELDFLPSDITDQTIAVAELNRELNSELNNEKIGLGRLSHLTATDVELGGLWVAHAYRDKNTARLIIEYLLNQAGNKRVFILPFKGPLTDFLAEFGFREMEEYERRAPQALLRRINFCESRYDRPICILTNKP